jgi:hypothetical protein
MLQQGDNLKDGQNNLGITLKDIPVVISYNKTNKLITALYMVTDIIDRDEPLRNKLRTLGTGIISDIHQNPLNALGKITEVMSFLDLAKALNIISPMNCDILRKEFTELDQSIRETSEKVQNQNAEIDLSELFRESPYGERTGSKYLSEGGTRIGVQRGSTLMKALSDKTNRMSDTRSSQKTIQDYDVLKRQRRSDIIQFIKSNGGSATITDIKLRGKGTLQNCGEKTLQRELVSMQKEGVLKKTGEKRWSRYFIQN